MLKNLPIETVQFIDFFSLFTDLYNYYHNEF